MKENLKRQIGGAWAAILIITPVVTLTSAVVIIYVTANQLGRTRIELKQAQGEKEALQQKISEQNSEIVDLKEELKKWREAFVPLSSIFWGELFYTDRWIADFPAEARPEDLWLAIRPCQWRNPDKVCTEADRDKDAVVPVLVVPWRPESGG